MSEGPFDSVETFNRQKNHVGNGEEYHDAEDEADAERWIGVCGEGVLSGIQRYDGTTEAEHYQTDAEVCGD